MRGGGRRIYPGRTSAKAFRRDVVVTGVGVCAVADQEGVLAGRRKRDVVHLRRGTPDAVSIDIVAG